MQKLVDPSDLNRVIEALHDIGYTLRNELDAIYKVISELADELASMRAAALQPTLKDWSA